MDRILNAFAVSRTEIPGRGSVLIDAGSAVTVDWLDEQHIFQGGCIFPGLDLMSEALHRYTALLPRVTPSVPLPDLPAKATFPAMQVGIFLAVTGGIREAVRLYRARAAVPPRIYLTGGQAPLIESAAGAERSWPTSRSPLGWLQAVAESNLDGPSSQRRGMAVTDTLVSVLTPPGTAALATIALAGQRTGRWCVNCSLRSEAEHFPSSRFAGDSGLDGWGKR